MEQVIDWTLEPLKQAGQIGDVIAAVPTDLDLLGVASIYLLAFAWLAYRWVKLRRFRHHNPSCGIPVLEGPVRLLSAVLILAIGLLFAVARAAGRSTFHAGGRF